MRRNSKMMPLRLVTNNSTLMDKTPYRQNTHNMLMNQNTFYSLNKKNQYSSNYNDNQITVCGKRNNSNDRNKTKDNNTGNINQPKNKINQISNNNIIKEGILLSNRNKIIYPKKFNDKPNIFMDYNNLLTKTQNKNNHSFYESKYILKNDNSLSYNINGKNTNNNTIISYSNKENINVSNILPNNNISNKNNITNIKQNSNNNNKITKSPYSIIPRNLFNDNFQNSKNSNLICVNQSIEANKSHRIRKIVNNVLKNDINKNPMEKEIIAKKLNGFQNNYIKEHNNITEQNKSFSKLDNIKNIRSKSNEKTKEKTPEIIGINKPINIKSQYISVSPKTEHKNSVFNNHISSIKVYNKVENNQIQKSNSKTKLIPKSNKATNILDNRKNKSENNTNIDSTTTFQNKRLMKANTFDIRTFNKYQIFTKEKEKNGRSTNNFVEVSKNSELTQSSSDYFSLENKYICTEKMIKSNKNIFIKNSSIFNKHNNIENDSRTIPVQKNKSSNKFISITTNPIKINENYSNKCPLLEEVKNNYIEGKSSGILSNRYKIDKKLLDLKTILPKNNNKGTYINISKKTSINPLVEKINYIKSCGSISVSGINEEGHNKINQDSFLIERNINGIFNFNIFGVLDGHGDDGHYASQFANRFIVNSIKNNSSIKNCTSPLEVYEQIKANNFKLIENIFLDADIQIRKEKFDYTNSGTTCVIVIQLAQKIICANTGDSRAIIVYNKNNDKNANINDILKNSKIFPLSYDCKPELPTERKRIYECGGIVEKDKDENDKEEGPYRVYIKGKEYPGLAMSRSIGDIDAKQIGVIPNPQFIEYTITDETKYMMICSDGVWEFISNEEAKKLGNEYYIKKDVNGMCQCLYKTSFDYWNKEEYVVDDITAVVVFF